MCAIAPAGDTGGTTSSVEQPGTAAAEASCRSGRRSARKGTTKLTKQDRVNKDIASNLGPSSCLEYSITIVIDRIPIQ